MLMKANELMEKLATDESLNAKLVCHMLNAKHFAYYQKEEERNLAELNRSVKDQVSGLQGEKSKLVKDAMIDYVKMNIARAENVCFFILVDLCPLNLKNLLLWRDLKEKFEF